MPIMGFGAENEMMHFVGVLVTPTFLVLVSFMILGGSHSHVTLLGQ